MVLHFADIVNGGFELCGGLFHWANVKKLWKDKQIRGIYWQPTLVFTTWGYWNLYYYPSLNQWVSVSGALMITLSNTAWILLALKYRKN